MSFRNILRFLVPLVFLFLAIFVWQSVSTSAQTNGQWVGWWHETSGSACGLHDTSEIQGSFVFDRSEKPVQNGIVYQIVPHTAADGMEFRLNHGAEGPTSLSVTDWSCDRAAAEPQYACPSASTAEYTFYERPLSALANYISPFVDASLGRQLEKIDFKMGGYWLGGNLYANEVFIKNTATGQYDRIHKRNFLDRGLNDCNGGTSGVVGPGPRLELFIPENYPLRNTGFANMHASITNDAGKNISTSFGPEFFSMRNAWWQDTPFGFQWISPNRDGWLGGLVQNMPEVTFTTNRTAITSGESITLNWSVKDAGNLCRATGDWSGEKQLRGTEVMSPTKTVTYTLQCFNALGTTERSIAVTVRQPEPAQLVFSADTLSLPIGGQVLLNWSALNVVTCTATGGWHGMKSATGSERITLSTTETFTLRCEAREGFPVIESITVEVDTATETIPEEELSQFVFSASPLRISRGDIARLSWQSPYVAPCRASGGWSGTKSSRSSEAVKPTATTTYSLECFDERGRITLSRSVTIEVVDPPSPPSPSVPQNLSQDPSIFFTASPAVIRAGQPITLWWVGIRVKSCAPFGDPWTSETGTLGSVEYYPTRSQAFSLQCTDLNGYALPPLSMFVEVEGAFQEKKQNTPAQPSDSGRGRLIREKDKDRYWYYHPVDQRLYSIGAKRDTFEFIKDFAVEKSYVETKKIPTAFLNASGGADADRDGLSNIFEEAYGTSRGLRDSDGDGYDDKTEIMNGYDPLGPGRIVADYELAEQSMGVIYRDPGLAGYWYVSPRDQKRYFFSTQKEFEAVLDKHLLIMSAQEVKKLRS